MAMYIKVPNNIDIEWHVGEKLNTLRLPHSKREWECMVVQADGDELNYILNTFTGIRGMKTAELVRWTGDDAIFIVSNMVISTR